MSINYVINKDDQEFYSKNDYVVLENFFCKSTIDALGKTITEAPESWWSSSTLDYDTHIPINVPYLPHNKIEIEVRQKHATSKLCTGEFCYRFDRLRDGHYENCPCNVCKFASTLHSTELLDFCKKFTDDSSLGAIPLEPFYSRYKTDDFLSLHTDAVTKKNGKPRKLAVVIHLTKNWKPWYGGNLMLLDKQGDYIKKALTPLFNSVTLMRVEEEGVPHYVDPLITGKFDKNRYAISMWY